jgi:ArsR family transcriptional regulator
VSSNSEVAELVDLFSVLSDPTRLRLLNLMNGREVCVCYFVEILKQPQPKISRHLAYMRRAGIVGARREGKWMHYSLIKPTDAVAAAILSAALDALPSRERMQADLACLDRTCSEPERFCLISAPMPSKAGN